jgi:hypothetical protein
VSLYKYCSTDRLDIIRDLRVRFTQPGAQNDPFELRPMVNRFRSHEVARQALSEPLSDEWNRQFSEKVLKPFGSRLVDEIENKIPGYFTAKKEDALAKADMESDQAAREEIIRVLNTLGIFSLSETPSDVLMWAHYATNHSGFVLELDGKHPWFWMQRPDGDDCGNLRKVSYFDQPSSPYLADLKAHEVFYTKGKKWDYEREWRIIRPLAESSAHIGEDIFLFDIPATLITGVIAGLRTRKESLQQLRGLLQSNPQLTHVRTGRIMERKNSNALEVLWA